MVILISRIGRNSQGHRRVCAAHRTDAWTDCLPDMADFLVREVPDDPAILANPSRYVLGANDVLHLNSDVLPDVDRRTELQQALNAMDNDVRVPDTVRRLFRLLLFP